MPARSIDPLRELGVQQRALGRAIVVALGRPRVFWATLVAWVVLGLVVGGLPDGVRLALLPAVLLGLWWAGRYVVRHQPEPT